MERMLFEFGMGFSIIWVLFAAVMLVVPYLVLRWRDSRHSPHDPQLGLKVAVHFSLTLAILLALIGLTIVAMDVIVGSRVSFPSEAARQGFGMLLAGLLLGALLYRIIRSRTNDLDRPMTRRLFTGARFILASIVVTVALGGLLANIFADSDQRTASSFLALLIVWGLEMGAEMGMLIAFTKQPNTPGGRACPTCGAAVPRATDEMSDAEPGPGDAPEV